MFRVRCHLIAWTTLAVVLFSAVSPAIAGALFAGRAEILGRMLGVAAAAQPAVAPPSLEDDRYPLESGHGDGDALHLGDTSQGSPDDTEHAAHGISCSFCLTANSVVSLPAADAAKWAVMVAALIPAGDDRQPASFVPASRHSRDPPAALS